MNFIYSPITYKKRTFVVKFLNQKGTSLAEVMIAAGMTGALSLVIASMMKGANESQKQIEAKNERMTTAGMINSVLANPAGCLATFDGLVTPGTLATLQTSTGVPVTSIIDKDGTTERYNSTSKIGIVTLTSMTLQDLNTNTDVATLLVKGTYKKGTQTINFKDLKLPLNMDVNTGTGALVSCASASANADLGPWQVMTGGPIGIFYNSGSVLIGSGTADTGASSPAFSSGTSNTVSAYNAAGIGASNTLGANAVNGVALGASNTVSSVNSFAGGHANTVNITTGSVGVSGPLASFALGRVNNVTGSEAGAVGYGNNISNRFSVAVGVGNIISGSASYSLGNWGVSDGTNAVTIGNSVEANGSYSIAMGYKARSSNTGSFTIGDNSTSTYLVNATNNAFASRFAGGYTFFNNIGTTESFKINANGSISSTNSTATGDDSVALGSGVTSTGSYSAALGRLSTAVGPNSFVVGWPSYVGGVTPSAGTAATAGIYLGWGDNGTITPAATGSRSVGIGTEVLASGDHSIAMGKWSTATQGEAVAIGRSADATGVASTAIGYDTEATGTRAFSFGSTSRAAGNYSLSLGASSYSYGRYSNALGYNAITGDSATPNVAVSNTSYANPVSISGGVPVQPWTDVQSGYMATAVGAGSVAYGDYSIAIGPGTTSTSYGARANGTASTAIGYNATASGVGSMAFGFTNSTRVNPTGFMSASNTTHAKGDWSMAMGSSATTQMGSIYTDSTSSSCSEPGNPWYVAGSIYNACVNGTGSMAFGYADARHRSSVIISAAAWAPQPRTARPYSITLASGWGTEICGTFDANGFCDYANATFIGGDGSVAIKSESANVAYTAGYALRVGGSAYANAWNIPSDQKLKKNIKVIENAVQKLKQLRGVEYYWRVEEFSHLNFSKQKDIGLIAQEVEKVFPHLVTTDTKGFKSLEYSKLVGLLVEVNKAQQVDLENLNRKVSSLEKRLEDIESRLNK